MSISKKSNKKISFLLAASLLATAIPATTQAGWASALLSGAMSITFGAGSCIFGIVGCNHVSEVVELVDSNLSKQEIINTLKAAGGLLDSPRLLSFISMNDKETIIKSFICAYIKNSLLAAGLGVVAIGFLIKTFRELKKAENHNSQNETIKPK